MSHVTRTPLSRSKGQGHQAALLTAVLAHQAVAAVGTRTCWPWKLLLRCPLLGGRRRPWQKAFRHPRGGGEGRGHTVVAAHLQLVIIMMSVLNSGSVQLSVGHRCCTGTANVSSFYVGRLWRYVEVIMK